MDIAFSLHAQRQLRERNISEKIVRDVVSRPTRVIDLGKGRKFAQKRVRWQAVETLCRVVYVQDDDMARVITAYVTTKFQKYE